MTIVLYRVTNAGDNIGNVPANEKITFNVDDDPNKENAFVTRYEIRNTTGIGNNQAAEQDLGDHQDLGPVENMYVLYGVVTIRNKGTGTGGINNFVEIMEKWDSQPKLTDDFIHGRMGIKIDDFQSYDIVPVGTGSDQIGLIWRNIDWDNNYAKHPLPGEFSIIMIKDKGDDS